MKILGIETSCDETAAAVVEDGTKIISNMVASSQSLHAKYGGIIPENAAREQVKSIIPVIKEALQISENIDALAVTIGPGLIGSLLVGVETAKALAFAWNKPIISVNHLIGHVYANWLASPPSFPCIVLIVSGGHTELVLMKGHGKFVWLGGTRDDAAGECFDKCARILGLGYPGGPAIETAASNAPMTGSDPVQLPRPMLNQNNFDFSFSGLKTAVANALNEDSPHLRPSLSSTFAYELQEAITDVLVTKTLAAARRYQVKSILLAGGVAANRRLREKLALMVVSCKLNVELHIPPVQLCTDNAACIASAAYFNYQPILWSKITADPGLDFSRAR